MLTARSVKQVRCPFFPLGSDVSCNSGTVPPSDPPPLEKVVRADLLLANRSDAWTYQVLHALQDFPVSQQFLDVTSSMLQFAVGFVITPSCRGGISKPKTRWNQKWAAGPHKSKTTQRSKRQVRKSDPSELRWEHLQVKAHAGGEAGKTTRAKVRHKKNA